MNTHNVVITGLVIVALYALRHLALLSRALWKNRTALGSWKQSFQWTRHALANDNPLTVGEHQNGRLTGYVDSAPTTTRFLLMKQGTLDNHYTVITSIADIPMGVCYDEPAATTDPVAIMLLQSAGRTLKMVGTGVIAAGNLLVTNGDGTVKALPAVAGVYWCVGIAVTSTQATNDLVEVDPDRGQVGVSIVT